MINKDFLDFSGLNIFFNKIKTLFALKSEIPTNYIVSGSQTTTSSTDGGSNIYTFTNSDGTLSTITVKNGSKGSSGTSITISSTSVMYQASSSGTTTPTGAWSESIPSTSAGQYLWTKTVVTYSDGNSTTSYSVSRNGSNGSNGSVGASGVGISKIEQTTTSTSDGGTNICTVTLTDGTTATFNFKNGSKGSSGTNGTSAQWFTGTAVSGTSSTAISVTVSGSKVGDMYLNTSTCNVYRASAANSWVYVCNIKGAAGTNGSNATTTAVATQTQNGLESAADKKKLDGIATGAEVNQNAFSNIVVNTTTVSADSKTDTLTLVAGDNIDITPDATNDKITISCTYDNPTFSVGSDGHLYMQH